MTVAMLPMCISGTKDLHSIAYNPHSLDDPLAFKPRLVCLDCLLVSNSNCNICSDVYGLVSYSYINACA